MDACKKIINSWTGTFNGKYNVSETGFITNSSEVTSISLDSGKDVDWMDCGYETLNICWETEKRRINGDHALLYIGVLGTGIINMIKMRKYLEQYNIDIYGYGTDSIYFSTDEYIENLRADKTSIETMNKQPYTLNSDEFRNKRKSYNKELIGLDWIRLVR